MADLEVLVTGGVDTHKDTHVAAALDQLGRVLGTETFPTSAAGYRSLLAWPCRFGDVVAVGVEGTGAWGAGLARHLAAEGVEVIEVRRANRQHRRRHGKSDPIDAISAARSVRAVGAWRASRVDEARDAPRPGTAASARDQFVHSRRRVGQVDPLEAPR